MKSRVYLRRKFYLIAFVRMALRIMQLCMCCILIIVYFLYVVYFFIGWKRSVAAYVRSKCQETLKNTCRASACIQFSKLHIARYHHPKILNPNLIDMQWMRDTTSSVCATGCDFTRPHFIYIKKNAWLLVEQNEDHIHIDLWGIWNNNKTHTWRQNIIKVVCDEDSSHSIVEFTTPSRKLVDKRTSDPSILESWTEWKTLMWLVTGVFVMIQCTTYFLSI